MKRVLFLIIFLISLIPSFSFASDWDTWSSALSLDQKTIYITNFQDVTLGSTIKYYYIYDYGGTIIDSNNIDYAVWPLSALDFEENPTGLYFLKINDDTCQDNLASCTNGYILPFYWNIETQTFSLSLSNLQVFDRTVSFGVGLLVFLGSFSLIFMIWNSFNRRKKWQK